MDPAHPPASPTSPSPNGQPDSSAASPTASEPAPRTSRAAGGVFIGDPGPAFDAKAAGDAPTPAPAEPIPWLQWEEDTVRGVLTAQGAAVHLAIGVGDEDWLYVKSELDTIAPPLTRILNTYDATRAAAAGGDAIAAAIGFGAYGMRSIMERRAVLAERDEGPQPVTGVRAPEGTGGEHDAAHQAARGESPEWTV